MEKTPSSYIDPPSSSRLRRSTLIAAGIAALLLLTVVLPAEYGIDPIRVGRVLGLTEMGEIKMQLAREAEAEDESPTAQLGAADAARLAAIEQRLGEIQTLLATGVTAADVATAEPPQPEADEPVWRHEISITLTPGQGVEYKLVMIEGAEAEFEWTATGGVLNYDTHGNGPGNSITYEEGRGEPEGRGVLVAAFDGDHGWFFRNRTSEDVQLTLRTRGDYSEFKRTV